MIDLNVVVQTMVGAGFGGLGAYVAIRERLAKLEERVDRRFDHTIAGIGVAQKTADSAHERIDNMLHRRG